jgi:hypothetical protein
MMYARSDRPSWSDEDLLTALDLRDHEGATYGQIAKVVDRSRSACIAMLSRIDQDTDDSDPDGNQNGTLSRGWWR